MKVLPTWLSRRWCERKCLRIIIRTIALVKILDYTTDEETDRAEVGWHTWAVSVNLQLKKNKG